MLTALKLAAKVTDNVGHKSFKNSRITADHSGIGTVLTWDGDNTLVSKVPMTGELDVVVDPKHLGKVLAQLKDGVLTQADDKLKITAGKRSVAINTIPRDLPEVVAPQCTWVPFNREKFLKTLVFVSACTSRDTSRLHLWGMLLNFSPAGIEMVATNRHGVHRHVVAPETGLAEASLPTIVTKISAGSISVLTALLKAVKTTSIRIGIYMNGLEMPVIYCCSGDHCLEIETEEIIFPAWESVVPDLASATCRFSVDVEDLAAALKLCQATTGSVSTVWTAGESLVVSADDRTGENLTEETVEIVGTSDAARFGINAEYVRAALEGLAWSRVEVRCSGTLDPVRFVDPGNPDYLAVIMPERM